MQNINANDLKIITEDLKKHIVDNHISNIVMVNSNDFLFTFSMYRKEKLFFSLSHNQPAISLVNIEEAPTTLKSVISDTLRKELRDAHIEEIGSLNNDRILTIRLHRSNDYFEVEDSYLVLELIPHKTNLIILDKEKKVIFALRYFSLDSDRPLLKGLTYSYPENKGISPESTINLDEYKKEIIEYFDEARIKRLKDYFAPLFTFVKNKIKSMTKKISILEKESNEASNNLVYSEHGNMLLAYAYDQDALKEYLNENKLPYDEKLTIGQNANKYFKIYKKSKKTIEVNKCEIDKAKSEIEEMKQTLCYMDFMDEDELIDLAKQLMPYKFNNNAKKVKTIKIPFIKCGDVKISFGKSSQMNDELTFKIANKNDYFYHIEGYHGSHVIGHTDHPSKDVDLIACEICLILSNKKDGNINKAQVKTLKKGKVPGQALLSNYETFTIRNVREKTIDLILRAKKN